MENTTSNPVTRVLAIILLSVIGGVLVFGGVGAWMLGSERIWTLAQFITGGIVTILVAVGVSLVIFSTSFPVRAYRRGPEQAMTTIQNVTHRYEGMTKEKETIYGDPPGRGSVQVSGPYPNPPFMVTGGGNLDMLPASKQGSIYGWEQLPANAEAGADTWEAEA